MLRAMMGFDADTNVPETACCLQCQFCDAEQKSCEWKIFVVTYSSSDDRAYMEQRQYACMNTFLVEYTVCAG